MNKKLTLTACIFTSSLLAACASSETPYIEGGASSSSNLIAAHKLTIAADDIYPEFVTVTYGDGVLQYPDTTIVPNHAIAYVNSNKVGETLTISVLGADRFGFKTTGNNITFKSNYGSIEQSCTITSGSCSVTLTTLSDLPAISNPSAAINPPGLEIIAANIVLYTNGEESFFDANGNGYFDDGDTFTLDMDEPYLDNNNNGQFDAGIDEPIDIDQNGTYTPADNLYSGSNCQHSSLCSPKPSTVIWDSMQIDLVSSAP